MNKEIRELLEKLKVNRDIMESIEEAVETGQVELIPDEQTILKVKISDEIAYDFYCDDFLDTREVTEVSIMDILYGADGNFKEAYNYSQIHVRRVRNDDFDIDETPHLTALVCYVLCKVNDYKYENIKTLEDIKEDIPLQVFISIVNKIKNLMILAKDDNDTEFAGILEKIFISKSMYGITVNAKLSIISKGPENFVEGKHYISLPLKYFVSKLEDLNLIQIKEGSDLYNRLTERGRRYVETTSEPKYCEYHGFAYTEGWFKDTRHRVDSRIMIDINAFKMLNSNIDSDWYIGNAAYSNNIVGQTLSEDKLWMCSPVVYGFSFNNKIWCKMNLEDIDEIKFSERAFDDLIIPEENKTIFTAALTHDMPSLDAISNKGGGKIFLLYGAPGVGKTMTAESVAEFLQKPLYFVSVGELGTNPEDLENSLDKVMKIAERWDAIVLLDEVDVFAVNRIGASIDRNAMTAIFLRMLERYSGVMFMTTNLKDNLDPAFISRATATIEYKSLTAKDRESIWNGILNKANALKQVIIDQTVFDSIPEHALIDINGRVIKNTIRLAYTLALTTEDKVLRNEHILMAIKLRG